MFEMIPSVQSVPWKKNGTENDALWNIPRSVSIQLIIIWGKYSALAEKLAGSLFEPLGWGSKKTIPAGVDHLR